MWQWDSMAFFTRLRSPPPVDLCLGDEFPCDFALSRECPRFPQSFSAPHAGRWWRWTPATGSAATSAPATSRPTPPTPPRSATPRPPRRDVPGRPPGEVARRLLEGAAAVGSNDGRLGSRSLSWAAWGRRWPGGAIPARPRAHRLRAGRRTVRKGPCQGPIRMRLPGGGPRLAGRGPAAAAGGLICHTQGCSGRATPQTEPAASCRQLEPESESPGPDVYVHSRLPDEEAQVWRGGGQSASEPSRRPREGRS